MATSSGPRILVASDNSSDADLVKRLLGSEFGMLSVSTVQEHAVEEFEKRKPEVLVLAFNALEKAERYYLGLYRLSTLIQSIPHRTIILCSKDEVQHVSQLCLKQHFDDYVLFWPLNHDAPRLPMSVHLAYRELTASRAAGPSVQEFVGQARRLAELESLLEQQVAAGGRQVDNASAAMAQAHRGIGDALDRFSQRLGQGALQDVVEIKNAERLGHEIARLKHDDIDQHLRAAAAAMQPIKTWAEDFRDDCAPHLEAARSLNAMADRVRPTVLIVDDDELQRNLVAKILEAQNYNLLFGVGGADALNILRKVRPDLILMDVQMPDIDGIEATRRLKLMPQMASVPVMMLTGKSEGTTVADSLKAGAVDFVVKPFNRDTLMAKVARFLRPPAVGAMAPHQSGSRV